MQKAKRLMAIERIIAEEDISSHEILLQRLVKRGFRCTQATLSRDLKQLGAGRIPDGKGKYRYSLPESRGIFETSAVNMQLLPVIRDMVDAKGLLVMRTIPGNASSTAYYIDNASRYEIAGTIAGDDTILIIPRDGITNQQVHNCLEIIMPGLRSQIRNKTANNK